MTFICPKCGNKTLILVNEFMYQCQVCGWFRSAHDLRTGVQGIKPQWKR